MFLIIFLVFVSSISLSFALDDNSTEISNSDDIPLETDDSSTDEVITAETDPYQVQTIKMNGVSKRYNGAIEYQAVFYDTGGNPLKNTKVFFEVDDYNDYESTTDSRGIALLTILINNGNHKIAAYNPSSASIEYDNIKVFDVITGGKNIKMYYDDGKTYKVRVFDNNGNPLKANQKVTFFLNNKKTTVKTDKNGYASFKLNQKPGFYSLYAQYKNFEVVNTIYIKPVLKSLTSFKSKVAKPTIKLKIKYLGKSKKNKKIKVKFNKKTYTAKTNKKGIATFILKTPKKIGVYNTKVIYKKSSLELLYAKYYL